MSSKAVIFGCKGTGLTGDEKAFFADAAPWGFILFARNISDPEQLRRLTGDLRECVGRDAPVLIDQEGGRVARMRAPAWREWVPALDECDRLPDTDLRVRAMYLRYRLIGDELRRVGIDVNCAPILDIVTPETHAVIRNRCYGSDPVEVAAIGRAVANGLLDAGVLPVMKHIPGQGRASLDSHKDLPAIPTSGQTLDAVDFAPFRTLADLPMAMTAHLIYQAHDPSAPATLSPEIVRIIRHEIGFDGLLMTDDLSMHALKGGFADRVTGAIDAGCDMVLHCNGDASEMTSVAGASAELSGRALERAEAALALRNKAGSEDAEEIEDEFARLRQGASHA